MGVLWLIRLLPIKTNLTIEEIFDCSTFNESLNGKFSCWGLKLLDLENARKKRNGMVNGLSLAYATAFSTRLRKRFKDEIRNGVIKEVRDEFVDYSDEKEKQGRC